MSLLAIYPPLLALAFATAIFWGFAIGRFRSNRPKFIASIGITLLATTLCLENSYYFAARLAGAENFVYFSYLEGAVGGMKLMYVFGLLLLVASFGINA